MPTLPDQAHITDPSRRTRFLVFLSSLRAEFNTRLARLAARIIEQHGGIVDLASMLNFDCPSYNQDIEEKEGLPAGAAELRKRIEANDAFVIASPEYNGSMPGLLKNVIDWVSRCGKQSGLITLLQRRGMSRSGLFMCHRMATFSGVS
jgi:chromate reductase, NAD(P)H dehydrogenase (quinone)